MKSFTVAAVVALASVASAQSVSITDIPSSILTCLTPVAGSDGCGLTDFACQCKVTDLITKTAPCVAQAPCADQQKGQSVLMQLCQQANVPISIPTPTCGGSASSAAPTSSAAAASSAASAASSAASAASSAASAASSLASKASSLAASATSAAASSAAAASKTGTPASYSAGAVPMATQAAGLIGAAALAMLAL